MSLKNIVKNIIATTMGYKELEFNVSGVSFKNGRKTRQAIIRAMKYKDEPFDKTCTISFERGDYEGALAISVLANGEVIGFVPKELVSQFNSYWVSDYIIEKWEVLGTGKDTPYGVRIKVLFNSK